MIKSASVGRFVGVEWKIDQRFLVEVSIHRSPEWGKRYFCGPVTAPSVADNSFFGADDIGDHEAKNEDDNNRNICDFFEKEELRPHYTTDGVWYWLNSRSGNPFPGQEMEQHGANPASLELKTGQHTFHLINREDGTCIDAIYATMNK